MALAAVEFIDTPEVLQGVKHRHDLFREHLETINRKHGVFKEIRGMGMLMGAQMSDAFEGRAKDILPLAIEEGVMALIAGPNARHGAPLVIPEEDIAEHGALERAIERLVASA